MSGKNGFGIEKNVYREGRKEDNKRRLFSRKVVTKSVSWSMWMVDKTRK